MNCSLTSGRIFSCPLKKNIGISLNNPKERMILECYMSNCLFFDSHGMILNIQIKLFNVNLPQCNAIKNTNYPNGEDGYNIIRSL